MFEIFDYNFLINLMLHSLILFTFLSLFFHFFISKVSKKAFNHEINGQIGNVMGKFLPLLRANPLYDVIKQNIDKNIVLLPYQVPDKKVKKANNRLLRNLLIANVVGWLVFFGVIYYLKSINAKINLLETLGENLIVFAFVGAAEYYFFTRIALKFIPVEPSFISKQFLEQLKTQFNK